MDIDKLDAGRELDALVAEKVMGWTLRYYPTGVNVVVGDGLEDILWHEDVVRWSPSTDIAAAWEMEEMIEQRGRNLRYTQALMAVLLFDGFVPERDEELWWALIHASPYQRCCVALKAVED